MQSKSSAAREQDQGDDKCAAGARESADGGPNPSIARSLWSKAVDAFGEVTNQASATGNTLASSAATVGTAAAAKAAEISRQSVDFASEVTRGTLESGQQLYIGSTLESAVNYIDGELEQRGAKKAIKDTTGAVVEKLDEVTGKRLVELLEAKLRTQDAYNDVLATRLAEALERIAKLEVRVVELQKGLGNAHEH